MRRQDSTGRVFAECQECHTGYWEPDLSVTFRGEDAEWQSSPAGVDESLAAGWSSLESI